MKATIVIPARYDSTRFPGKPLAQVRGRSLVERVWRIACSNTHGAGVVVATDDDRIADHVTAFGGTALLTSTDCRNGTERMFEAVKIGRLDGEAFINLQGDALLTPPWIVDAMIEELARDPSVEMITPAVELAPAQLDALARHKKSNPASGTTVVFNSRRDALYFSKALLPFQRSPGSSPTFRHIGLYGFRRRALERFVSLAPTPLEQAEGLEQLRALENGMAIRVVLVDYKGRTHGSVDSPGDVAAVEQIIAREGELFDQK